MQIRVNGEAIEFDGDTVAELLVFRLPENPFAVAVNTVFVPRHVYADTRLHTGDAVDIVRPVVGG